jgi:hypothetical protein
MPTDARSEITQRKGDQHYSDNYARDAINHPDVVLHLAFLSCSCVGTDIFSAQLAPAPLDHMWATEHIRVIFA